MGRNGRGYGNVGTIIPIRHDLSRPEAKPQLGKYRTSNLEIVNRGSVQRAYKLTNDLLFN